VEPGRSHWPAEAVTDDDGAFELRGLRPGPVRFQVFGARELLVLEAPIVIDVPADGRREPRPFRVRRGVWVGLRPDPDASRAASAPDPAGRLEVVSADGTVVVRASVGWLIGGWLIGGWLIGGGDGFVVALPFGGYRLRWTAPDGRVDELPLEVNAAGSEPAAVPFATVGAPTVRVSTQVHTAVGKCG